MHPDYRRLGTAIASQDPENGGCVDDDLFDGMKTLLIGEEVDFTRRSTHIRAAGSQVNPGVFSSI
jgi:hypothetical protein